MEKKAGRNKGKTYEKPLSLHPMKFEDALKSMFRDPSMQFSVKPNTETQKDLKNQSRKAKPKRSA